MKNILNIPVFLIFFMFGSCETNHNKNRNKDHINTIYSVRCSSSFSETGENLQKFLKKRDIIIFAEIDHSLEAKGVEMELLPTKLFIIGNPKLGTLLMQENQSTGIDLPLKILVTQNAKGEVWIHYKSIKGLIGMYNIEENMEIVENIDGNMKKLMAAFVNQ